ncbi:MAG: thermonuclease family protein [Planctomycetota bacterium]|jgi:endonuclease YncB( thermonuclease family)|nr:thermonuclease family protein [Planctomycetota bacterium]
MKKLGCLFLLTLLGAVAAAAGEWSGFCVGISDGDTITVLKDDRERVKVRLYGIDCPESSQDYGTRARQMAGNLAYQKIVAITPIDTDRYGRTVGLVVADGVLVNRALVESGMAWVYSQYCRVAECEEWRNLEEAARKARRGLWEQPSPVPPWEWRRGRRAAAPQETPRSVSYHGNTSNRIFHREECRFFNCSDCNAVFPSRDAALQAGYRPCRVCKP